MNYGYCNLRWDGLDRRAIKKGPSDRVKALKAFLIEEEKQGGLSRQETVSMIPVEFLGVKPGHIVMDMCAAPGSKTGQLVERLAGQGLVRSAAGELHSAQTDQNPARGTKVFHEHADSRSEGNSSLAQRRQLLLMLCSVKSCSLRRSFPPFRVVQFCFPLLLAVLFTAIHCAPSAGRLRSACKGCR